MPLLACLRGTTRTGRRAHFFLHHRFAFGLGKASAARAGKFLRSATVLLGLALLHRGLARPQLGKSLTQVEASGIDIMLVLDVSASMLTKDFTIGGEQATRIDSHPRSDAPNSSKAGLTIASASSLLPDDLMS